MVKRNILSRYRTFGALNSLLLIFGSVFGALSVRLADRQAIAHILERGNSTTVSDVLCVHFAAAIFGLAAFGIFVIPSLCMSYGFASGYAVAAHVLNCSGRGIPGTLIINHLMLLFTIPFLLCISTVAMQYSRDLIDSIRGKDRRIHSDFRPSGYFILMGMFLLLSFLAAEIAFSIQRIIN